MSKLGLLFLAAILLAGCAFQRPTATPTTVSVAPTTTQPADAAATQATPPTPPPVSAIATVVTVTPDVSPAPTETAIPIDLSDVHCANVENTDGIPPAIGEVIERLGYALQPAALPDGFKLAGVFPDNNAFRQVYQDTDKNIIIAYPLEFSPDPTTDPLGWERPQDAVSSLQIGDQTVHLMIGGWSDASIIAGPALKPDRAEWDYDKSLALFFACRVDGGLKIPIAIQASQSSQGPIDWMDVGKIVEIAQSLERISRSR